MINVEKFICNRVVPTTGMDQRKTSLPYDSVEQMSAADTAGNRISQAVMGGIIHGIGKYFYVSDGQLLDLKGGDFGERARLPFADYACIWSQ